MFNWNPVASDLIKCSSLSFSCFFLMVNSGKCMFNELRQVCFFFFQHYSSKSEHKIILHAFLLIFTSEVTLRHWGQGAVDKVHAPKAPIYEPLYKREIYVQRTQQRSWSIETWLNKKSDQAAFYSDISEKLDLFCLLIISHTQNRINWIWMLKVSPHKTWATLPHLTTLLPHGDSPAWHILQSQEVAFLLPGL